MEQNVPELIRSWKFRQFREDVAEGGSNNEKQELTLISRWMTPARWHCKMASTTWRKKFLASGSDRAPCSVMKSKRSWDISARSMISTNTSSASQASNNRTTPATWDTWRSRQTSSGTRMPPICQFQKEKQNINFQQFECAVKAPIID